MKFAVESVFVISFEFVPLCFGERGGISPLHA